MKKILFLCLCGVIATGAFAQAARQQQPTIEEAIAILDGNFTAYPYVHQLLTDKTDDNRPRRCKITRQPYEITIEEKGEEKTVKAEVVIVEIINNGYRYELKFDFTPKKEKGTKFSKTVWNTVRSGILNDLSEFFPKKEAAPAAQN